MAPGRRSAERRPGPIWTGGVLTAYVIYQGNVLDEERYEEYTEIRKLRDGAAEAILYVVDGIDQ